MEDYRDQYFDYLTQQNEKNMATAKKKIDWTKIWKIVRDILIALLTAEQAREVIQ